MGRTARAARHVRVMQQKRAMKAERRARYESYRGTSRNKRSKQRDQLGVFNNIARELMLVPVLVKGQIVKALRLVHGGPKCKNVGCKRCSAIFQIPLSKMDKALIS